MRNLLGKLSVVSAVALLAGCSKPDFDAGTPSNSPAGNTYSVKTFGGVPMIAEDGSPVRGRMFYGAFPGEKYAKVSAQKPSVISTEFESPADAQAGLRMSFEMKVRNVYIYGVNLVDLTDGGKKLALLEPSEKNSALTGSDKNFSTKIDGDAIVLTKNTDPQKGATRFFTKNFPLKKGHKYRLDFKLKYDTDGWFDAVSFIGGRGIIAATAQETFTRQQKLAAENSVNFVTLGIPVAWNEKQLEFLKPRYAKIFGSIAATNPKSRVIARVGVEPSNEWLDAHPDSEMRGADGKRICRTSRGAIPIQQRFVSLSSEEFRRDACNALSLTVKYLESNYGKIMAGYHPCAGNTGEWFYGQSSEPMPTGYDPATVSAWRKWLSKKYGDNAALRKAWNKPDADLASAAVPTAAERQGTGSLIDPQKNQSVFDFNLFLQDEITDTILLLAKTLKTDAPNKLSIFFYGYGFEMSATYNGPAVCGHFGSQKLLESPLVDGLCGPISYQNRGLGGCKSTMGASESCAANGKLWLDEDDNRTYLLWSSGSVILVGDKKQRTIADSVKVMRRNLAQGIIRNNPSWWMDLFGTGWYDDPELWKQVELFRAAESDMLAHPKPFAPQVALVYDEPSMCAIGMNSWGTSFRALALTRLNSNKTGAPFGQYLLGDILARRATPKLSIITAAYAMTAEQRAKAAKVADDTSFLWVWAPAYIDISSGKFSTDAVKEATGFSVRKLDNIFPFATPTDAGKKRGIKTPFGHKARFLLPTLSPIAEKGDEILATFSNGMPAVILRTSTKHPQIFCAIPDVSLELERAAMKAAGVKIYTEQPAAVFANGNYVSVCASTTEPHEIDLGFDGEIFDALDGKKLGVGPKITLDMKAGDIVFMRLGK